MVFLAFVSICYQNTRAKKDLWTVFYFGLDFPNRPPISHLILLTQSIWKKQFQNNQKKGWKQNWIKKIEGKKMRKTIKRKKNQSYILVDFKQPWDDDLSTTSTLWTVRCNHSPSSCRYILQIVPPWNRFDDHQFTVLAKLVNWDLLLATFILKVVGWVRTKTL